MVLEGVSALIVRGRVSAKGLPFAVVLIFGLFVSGNLIALDERKLDDKEIKLLLANRTALGENRGIATRQFFDPAGWTDYLEQGGRPDRGKWRVDENRGEYCSQWGSFGDWSCYAVTTDGRRYYWTQPGTDYRSPFTMVDGYKMAF